MYDFKIMILFHDYLGPFQHQDLWKMYFDIEKSDAISQSLCAYTHVKIVLY